MTGRIKSLDTGSGSGSIAAETGANVYFHSSAVLAYDITSLCGGQLVTFDLESGLSPRASNVCVQREHHGAALPDKRRQTSQLRYMGFDQLGSIRAYRFDRLATGQETKTFIVTADLALFRKHRVGIQDGPALCLHTLMTELDGPDSTRPPSLLRGLTDGDMLAHLACRPVPGTKPRSKGTFRATAAPHAV